MLLLLSNQEITESLNNSERETNMTYFNILAQKVVNARMLKDNVTEDDLTTEQVIKYWDDAKNDIEPALLEYYVAKDKLESVIKNLTK